MPPTAMGIGKGALLKRGDAASPEVFTTVAEITKIGDFGGEKPPVEATSLDSSMEDFVLGLQKGGAISLEANFLPDNATQGSATGVILDHTNETRRNWKITMPSSIGGKSYLFTALVSKWRVMGIDPKGAVKASFDLQVVQGAATALNASVPFYYA